MTGKSLCVYSVGDGTVLIHTISKDKTEPARDLNLLLSEANNSIQTKIRSEVAWVPGYDSLLLGSEDGWVVYCLFAYCDDACEFK